MDLQIKVVCVLNHEDEYPTEALLHIKDHCDLLNIPFYTRAFDSIKFSEDRKYIEKLPAFHIFVKGRHKDTFYTDSAPKLKIRSVYDTYKEKANEKAVVAKTSVAAAAVAAAAVAVNVKAKGKLWSIFNIFSKPTQRLTEWK